MSPVLFALRKLCIALAVPPGFFILAGEVLGVWLLAKRDRKRGLTAIFLANLLYLCSIPLSSQWMMSQVEIPYSALPQPGPITVVAVLSADGVHVVPDASKPAASADCELGIESSQRLAAGVDAANHYGCPLIYSGSDELGGQSAESVSRTVAQTAQFFGLKGALTVDAVSKNTWENMQQVAKIVKQQGAARLILVTSAYHMKRAVWMAKKPLLDVEVVPYPSEWRSTAVQQMFFKFVPSAASLADFSRALTEMLALTVYGAW